METNLKEIDKCKRELELTLLYDELLPHFEKALSDYRKKATHPGFRKGKVPISIIKKLYNDSIEYYSLEDIANDKFKQYVIENKVPLIGTGKIIDINYKPKEQLFLKFEFEVKPDIKLEKYKGIELKKTVYEIDDSIIEEELQYLKLRNSSFEIDGEAIDDEYMITVDTQEIDNLGNPIIAKSDKNVRLYLGSSYLSKDYRNSLKNIKENETRIVDTSDENKNKIKLEVKCTKVEKIIYPELNQETIKKFIGRDGINNEDELKNYLKNEIKKSYDNLTEQNLRNNAIQEIVKLNDVPLPDTFVDAILSDYFNDYKQKHAGHDHDMNEEEFMNKNKPEAVFTGKWFLIKEKLIELEDIKVTDEDVKEFAEKNSNLYNIPADKLFDLYKSNEEIKNNIINNKVLEFIINNAVVSETKEIKKSEQVNINQ